MDTLDKINLRTIGNVDRTFFPTEGDPEEFTIRYETEQPLLPLTPNGRMTILFGSTGKAAYRINGEKAIISERTIQILHPEDTLVPESQTEDYREHRLSFTSAFVRGIPIRIKIYMPIMRHIRRYPRFRIAENFFADLEYCLQGIDQLSRSNRQFKIETAQQLLSVMFLTIADAVEMSEKERQEEHNIFNRKYSYYESFLELASKHYGSERFVSFYAGKLCLTAKYLSTIVKEVSGKSASEWIDEFVISEAQSLLKSSDMSIQQIAYELNFPNPSFFGKYFKSHTGVSPQKYRTE